MAHAVGSLRDSLIELEHRFWEASTDAAFYRSHLLPDAVMVFPSGFGIVDAERVIELVAENTAPWVEHTLTDVHVVEGVDSAILAYRARARRADSDDEFHVFASSVYVHLGGEWKLALHQQTPA